MTAPIGRVVLYDGLCGLCDRSVRFLARHDRRGALRFAPLQGEFARRARSRHAGLPASDETLLLVESGPDGSERIRVRSDAVLAAVAAMGGRWRLVAGLRIVPAFVRDALYRWVARRRKRWFGELAACRVPTPAERPRFLEEP